MKHFSKVTGLKLDYLKEYYLALKSVLVVFMVRKFLEVLDSVWVENFEHN